MKCREMRGLIMTDYIDNELDDGARSAVELHLAECAECRAVLASSRALADRFRAVPVVSAPPSLWPAVRRQWELRREAGAGVSLRDMFLILRGGWALNATLILSLLACMSLAGMYCTGNIMPASTATGSIWETAAFNDIPGEQAEKVYTDLARD